MMQQLNSNNIFIAISFKLSIYGCNLSVHLQMTGKRRCRVDAYTYTHRHTHAWTQYTVDYYSAINKNEILPFAMI